MDIELFFGDGRQVPSGARIVDRGNGKVGVQVKRNCGRCGGAGESDRWIHTGKVCFNCNGSGVSPTHPWSVIPVYTIEKLAKLTIARDKRTIKREEARKVREAAEQAAADALRSTFLQQHGDLLVEALALNEREAQEWVASIVEQARQRCVLSEKQEAALRGFIERTRARRAKVAARRHIDEVGAKIEERVRLISRYGSSHPVYGYSESVYLEVIEGSNQGNLIAYKGKSLADLGESAIFTVSGKVKQHGNRKNDGSPYVLVERPKISDIVEKDEEQ